MHDHLVYLCVGRDDLFVQARHAIASALAWSEGAPVDVLVYTDRPEAFDALGARVRALHVSPETTRAWRGRWDFLYRMKPEVVRDALRRDPGGRVLFADVDTFFTGPVADAFQRIGGRQAVMHLREYHVGTRDTVQMRSFRRRTQRARFRGEPIELDVWMWNSGLIGLEAAHLPLVEDWLDLVDQLFPHNPKPIVEQFGLSLLLQRAGLSIAPGDDRVVHYHAEKDRYVAAITARLEALARLPPAEAARVLREEPLPLGDPPPRRRRSVLRRVSASIAEKVRVRRLLARGP